MDKKTVTIIIIISMIIGGVIGYMVGFSAGIKWTVDIGLNFLRSKGINLNVDENMLKTAILQYKENIGGCYFTKPNASLYSN